MKKDTKKDYAWAKMFLFALFAQMLLFALQLFKLVNCTFVELFLPTIVFNVAMIFYILGMTVNVYLPKNNKSTKGKKKSSNDTKDSDMSLEEF